MKLAGSKVLVLGLGISGVSAANFCAARGARVVAADEAPESALAHVRELDASIALQTGGALPDPSDFDLLVPSPGIPRARYADSARRIWGDIELAGQALEIPIVAVTGTNGKSTTVLLIESMLRAAGLRARAAGNVGTPALSLVGEALDVAILEISSFQLETVESFRPRVSAILNVTPDHLDRHGDLSSYIAAKAAIFANQRDDDAVVLNFDDDAVRELARGVRARVIPFSRRKPLQEGVCLDGGSVLIQDDRGARRLSLDDLALRGVHNLENVLAAVACVHALGIDLEQTRAALAEFRGLPHRAEMVAERDGVTWINDSKATNPGAAMRSLESFDGDLIWIAGGRDKGLDFVELGSIAARRVKLALLVGEAANSLEIALAERIPVENVENLDAAVRVAAAHAQPGDTVLLAPACASFDQFDSFEARGEAFRDAVVSIHSEDMQ